MLIKEEGFRPLFYDIIRIGDSMRDVNAELFSWLAMNSTTDEFLEEVTSIIERENNEWLLTKIDTELREHMEVVKELLTTCTPDEEAELNGLITNITLKLGILRNVVDSYQDNQNLADELEQDPDEVKVVFAKNQFGNVMALKQFEDVKSYGDDKYQDLLSLLDRLLNGDTDFNQEKQRPLRSSDKLKGIYELKAYQIRLIYMREGEYTVVIGACVKKDDNDLRYRSSLENMKKKSAKYRQNVQNGKLDMEQELKESKELVESLTAGYAKR